MKNILIFSLVAALLMVSVGPALAQTSGFTVNPDRVEATSTKIISGTEAEDDWKEPTTSAGDSVGGDGEDIGAPSDEENPRSILDSAGDAVGGESEDIGAPSQTETTGIEHEDIGGAVRQNNESDYDFVLRAISTETTAQAIYIKIGDIKGESSDERSGGNVEYEWKVEEGESFKKPREIVVVGSKVRGWDALTKEAVLNSAPARASSVSSAPDLALFAAKVVAETQDAVTVESVTLNFEKITWEYKQQGRFLGFIPLSVRTTLEVNDEPDSYGRVKVQFPWYARFIGNTLSEGELVQLWEDQLSSVGDDAQLANIDLQNQLQKQAQTLQMMSNVSKMLHDTAMSIIRKIG